MKTKWLLVGLAFLLGAVALGCAETLYTIGSSFAVWSPGHDVGYFINIHAGLLEKAGIAISALSFALFFGLLVAFRRIRELELKISAVRTQPNQLPEPTLASGTSPAGQEPRHR
jgi:hypothetical protein